MDAALEAFSFVYLTSYNDIAIPTRVSTSLQRAWDFDELRIVARVSGGRPGYTVVKWQSPRFTKIMVAIEGTSTLSQLWSAWNGYNAVPATPLQGHVYHAFKTYADTIKAELLANASFLDGLNQPFSGLTFTGKSLGAGIAEVLGTSFRLSHPAKSIHVVKFGSPRVGTNRWYSNNPTPEKLDSWYLESDPIGVVPYMTMHQIELMDVAWANWTTFYAKTPNSRTIDQSGDRITGVENEDYGDFINAMRQARTNVDVNNAWFWHDNDQYRAALTGLSVAMSRESEYRFRYLEYPDDNQWGQQYRERMGFHASMKLLFASNAPDVVVPFDEDREEVLVVSGGRWGEVEVPNPIARVGLLVPAIANPAWRPRKSRNF